MICKHWRRTGGWVEVICLCLLLLSACSSPFASAPTQVTPTPSPGGQLLAKVRQQLFTAKTLHGKFNLTVHGKQYNGSTSSELWLADQQKKRVEIHQSSLQQFRGGAIAVTDGKNFWQYNPAEKEAYLSQLHGHDNIDAATFSPFDFIKPVFDVKDATLLS